MEFQEFELSCHLNWVHKIVKGCVNPAIMCVFSPDALKLGSGWRKRRNSVLSSFTDSLLYDNHRYCAASSIAVAILSFLSTTKTPYRPTFLHKFE